MISYAYLIHKNTTIPSNGSQFLDFTLMLSLHLFQGTIQVDVS